MPLAQKDLYKKLLGSSGEKSACRYLKKQGYRIQKRNLRTPFGEVDIVAEQGDTLVFIEVKTCTGEAFGTAAQHVTPQKVARYRKTAQWFLLQEEEERAVRFDVVEVYPKGIPESVLTEEERTAKAAQKKRTLPEIRLIENAF